MRLRWGDSGDLEAALAVLGGKSASLVVAADVLYEATPAAADELEQTLRGLFGKVVELPALRVHVKAEDLD